MIAKYICYASIAVFIIWMAYIQIRAWGNRGNIEMQLMDRVHEEVIYQLCYKRGYHITLVMDDDAYWTIENTDHPSRRMVKFIIFWSFVHVLFFSFNYRTNKNPDFDDYDPKWEVPTNENQGERVLGEEE